MKVLIDVGKNDDDQAIADKVKARIKNILQEMDEDDCAYDIWLDEHYSPLKELAEAVCSSIWTNEEAIPECAIANMILCVMVQVSNLITDEEYGEASKQISAVKDSFMLLDSRMKEISGIE